MRLFAANTAEPSAGERKYRAVSGCQHEWETEGGTHAAFACTWIRCGTRFDNREGRFNCID